MVYREARDNMVRALDVIHFARSKASPLLLLSTDAEKVFDRVNWDFLRAVLDRVGLGPQMKTCVGALYSSPTASVMVNGVLSEPFQISNGMRQGCPLSPLIFILSLEPFLRHIRSNADINGIKIKSKIHKTSHNRLYPSPS